VAVIVMKTRFPSFLRGTRQARIPHDR